MHVVITGASSGLGEAMAVRFAKGGHRLTLIARREQRLEALAARLPGSAAVVVADLVLPGAVETVVEEARLAHGPIDVWINNAGIQYVEAASGVSSERVKRLFDLNVTVPLQLAALVLPEMTARGAGTVVNIASVSGITPTPWMAHYSASKAAMGVASELTNQELRGTGVRSVTVYPGPVETDMEGAARRALEEGPLVSALPMGSPEGLAAAVYDSVTGSADVLFYPRTYALARWTGRAARWLTRALAPSLRV